MEWGVVCTRGPCPHECDDLVTAWTSSASAHPATSLLALPVVSSLPCWSREGCGGEELSQCPGLPSPGQWGQGSGCLADWVPARLRTGCFHIISVEP